MQKINAWDSHPADNDRITHVLKRKDSAIVTDEYPVHLLSNDIKKLCQQLTLFTYRQYGIQNPEKYITENTAILKLDKEKQNASMALDKFFNKNYYGRFLNLESIENQELAPKTLEDTINKLRQDLVDYASHNKKHQELIEKYSIMTLGMTYLKDNVNIDHTDFYLAQTDLNQIDSSISSTKEQILKLSRKLAVTDQLFFHRLQQDAKLMNTKQLKRFKFQLSVLKQIEKLTEKMFNLQHNLTVMGALTANDEELADKIKKSMTQYGQYCFADANNILELSKQIANGKEDSNTLYSFIQTWCDKIPDQHNIYNPHETLNFSSQVLGAVKYHYYWVLADICELALLIETNNNIAPIRLVPDFQEALT